MGRAASWLLPSNITLNQSRLILRYVLIKERPTTGHKWHSINPYLELEINFLEANHSNCFSVSVAPTSAILSNNKAQAFHCMFEFAWWAEHNFGQEAVFSTYSFSFC